MGNILVIILIVIPLLLVVGIGLYYLLRPKPVSPIINESTPSNFTTTVQTTKNESSGGGNTVYLDRQYVNCGSKSVLNEFQLIGVNNDSSIQYKYTCKSSDTIGAIVPTLTNPENNGGGNVNYLDRLNVECNKGYAIGGFHLAREGVNQVNNLYEYTCLPVSSLNTLSCVEKSTPYVSNRGGSSLSLTDLNVICSPNQVLTQFKLETQQPSSFIRYNYTCCSV